MATISHITLPDGTDYSIQATGIFYGEVDSTSTSTAFTASISGVTEYYDGLTVLLKNGRVTSAENFTININNLGAKGSYNNMATGNSITPTSPTRDTTIFNINYTMLFIYNSTLVSGGCWIGYRGYDSDTDAIAYNVRRGQIDYVTNTVLYRYQICFTMSNGELLPANTSSNTTGTSKTLTTTAFDPFQPIIYYGDTATVKSGNTPDSSYMWYSNVSVDLRYAFNTGETLTSRTPVYIRLTPQSDGTVKLDGNDCIVQALPSTEDNKLYLYLGRSYSDHQISLDIVHPIYYYKNGAIRLWTNTPTMNVPIASSILKGDGNGGVTAAVAGTDYAELSLGISGASVGDLIKVTAVDANGKPTAWAKAVAGTDYQEAIVADVPRLLISILNAVASYSPSQTANISALAALILEITIIQSGATLYINGVPDVTNVSQSGSVLTIT